MKYKNIASTLGWDEDHAGSDPQDGVYLQAEELAALDKALAATVTTVIKKSAAAQTATDLVARVTNTQQPGVTAGVNYPFASTAFKAKWDQWKAFRADTFKELENVAYKTQQEEQSVLTSLHKQSNGVEHLAITIIDKSIASKSKGFYITSMDQDADIVGHNTHVNESRNEQYKTMADGGNKTYETSFDSLLTPP